MFFAAADRSGRLIDVEKRYGNIGRSEVRKLSVLQAFRITSNDASLSYPDLARALGPPVSIVPSAPGRECRLQ